ncbi:nucleoside 2-deoxyribosyltransferase [Xenophilus sp.]|uniref:nucleoside 2-deoxyribosyltransferase n=1 Tax=Xenophilus sp. TaxID=1873499 RepID=UPI0037DC2236
MPLPDQSRRPRIYLAGPDVFRPDAERVFAGLKAQCDALGLQGVAPTDAGVDTRRGSDDEIAQRIYEGNVRLLRGSDGVIAHLAPFRGLEPDAGTVFEVGYAAALGLPVVAYGVPEASYEQRVCAAIGCARDAQGAMREAGSGTMVEGLGQRMNLMLTRSTAIEADAAAALRRIAALLGR